MCKLTMSFGLLLGTLARLAIGGEMAQNVGTLSAQQYAAQKADLQQKATTEISRVRMKQILAHHVQDKNGFLEARRQEHELIRQYQKDQKNLDERFAVDGNAIDKIQMGFAAKNVLKEVELQRLDAARQSTIDRLKSLGKTDQNGKAIAETPDEQAREQLAVNKELAKARAAALKQFQDDVRLTRNPPPKRFTRSGQEIPPQARTASKSHANGAALPTKHHTAVSPQEIETAVNDMTLRAINEAERAGKLSSEKAVLLRVAAESQHQEAEQRQ